MTGVFLALAENVLIDRLMSNQAPFTGKNKLGLTCMVVAGLMFLIALVFFIYAAYVWVSYTYPPEVAAMVTGGLALGLSLLIGLGAFAFLRYKRARAREYKAELSDTIHSLIALADEDLTQPIRDNPKTSVLIASVAGFIAGEKFV